MTKKIVTYSKLPLILLTDCMYIRRFERLRTSSAPCKLKRSRVDKAMGNVCILYVSNASFVKQLLVCFRHCVRGSSYMLVLPYAQFDAFSVIYCQRLLHCQQRLMRAIAVLQRSIGIAVTQQFAVGRL
jgi:hypothetical protein